MSGAGFLRIKKLKGGGHVTVAARHNKREIQEERGAGDSIDPTRSRLNYTLGGPAGAADVGQLARDLMQAAGVGPLRKDAVTGIELVFSLPVDSAIDGRAYFTACAAWAGAYFGGADNVLSVDVHLDEGAPHCHIIILPLVDGHMNGNKMAGGPGKFLAMQKQFHEAVASRHGLSRAPARMSGTAKQDAASKVLARLRETGDSALQSKVWATLRDAIERAPEPFLLALSITTSPKAKPLRTMAQIFTSKGKGKSKEPNAIAFDGKTVKPAKPNAIAFEKPGAEKEQRLCSVVFAQKAPAFSPHIKPVNQRQPASHQHDDIKLTGTPNDDGEVAPPTRHDLPDVDGATLHDTHDGDQSTSNAPPAAHGVCPNVDTPFIELTTRHRDDDQTDNDWAEAGAGHHDDDQPQRSTRETFTGRSRKGFGVHALSDNLDTTTRERDDCDQSGDPDTEFECWADKQFLTTKGKRLWV